MITKEISEVEKEIIKEVLFSGNDMRRTKVFPLALRRHLPEIEDLIKKTIDSTLKSAQAKFDKFVEDLKSGIQEVRNHHEKYILKESDIQFIHDFIDELSSKQEGKE
jgi:predicted transcriptional regulator